MGGEGQSVVRQALGIAGNISGICGLFAPVPTFAKIIKKKSTGQFSAFPYVASLLSSSIWTIYGYDVIPEKGIQIMTLSLLAILMQVAYLGIFVYFADHDARTHVYKMLLGVTVIFALLVLLVRVSVPAEEEEVAYGICGDVLSVISCAAPLSIIGLVIRTRSVEFMPISLAVYSAINSFIWFLFAVSINDVYIALPNVIAEVLAIIQIAVYVKYRKCIPVRLASAEHQPLLTPTSKAEENRSTFAANPAEVPSTANLGLQRKEYDPVQCQGELVQLLGESSALNNNFMPDKDPPQLQEALVKQSEAESEGHGYLQEHGLLIALLGDSQGKCRADGIVEQDGQRVESQAEVQGHRLLALSLGDSPVHSDNFKPKEDPAQQEALVEPSKGESEGPGFLQESELLVTLLGDPGIRRDNSMPKNDAEQPEAPVKTEAASEGHGFFQEHGLLVQLLGDSPVRSNNFMPEKDQLQQEALVKQSESESERHGFLQEHGYLVPLPGYSAVYCSSFMPEKDSVQQEALVKQTEAVSEGYGFLQDHGLLEQLLGDSPVRRENLVPGKDAVEQDMLVKQSRCESELHGFPHEHGLLVQLPGDSRGEPRSDSTDSNDRQRVVVEEHEANVMTEKSEGDLAPSAPEFAVSGFTAAVPSTPKGSPLCGRKLVGPPASRAFIAAEPVPGKDYRWQVRR